MTNAPEPEEPGRPHPLLPGASPATIRSYLLPDDRSVFLAAYEEALDLARRSLDVTPVLDVVEQWRRIAVLQSDPARFRRTARRAAERYSGTPSPSDEPLEVTRAKAGM